MKHEVHGIHYRWILPVHIAGRDILFSVIEAGYKTAKRVMKRRTVLFMTRFLLSMFGDVYLCVGTRPR